jgi:hypothetical protein
MGEVVGLREYQREASAAANQEPPWTTVANELLAAGWDHKVRGGLRIWTDSSKPFRGWYSEAVAHGKLRGEIP